MLRALFLVCFLHTIDGQSPAIWGSSVITEIAGPSPLLHYVNTKSPYVKLDRKKVEVEKGACYVSGKEIGKPCSITNTSDGFVTELQISSVENHRQLVVSGHTLHTTFFAPNCVFPKALADEVIPEPSLPLFRFMKGFSEVNITFAMSVDQQNLPVSTFHFLL
uniref:DUF5727 domain-containing protein n=1 Tax=Schistocephalus solidus TaxID=70667 RepID=A0A0X3PKB0_SCHSO